MRPRIASTSPRGYKGDTSQAQQTLAALKAFGLVGYNGSGPKRLVSISEDARTFLRAQQESIRSGLLRKFALTPKWIAHFWPIWGNERGPDEICLDTLVLFNKFNENAAPKFLSVYDETIDYAGLSKSDKNDAEHGEAHACDDDQPADTMQTHPEPTRRATAALHAQPIATSPPQLGKPRIVMNGDHLDIHASVDLEGLRQLQTMLGKLWKSSK